MNKTFREHCRGKEKMSSAVVHSINSRHRAATIKGGLSPIAKSLLLLFVVAMPFAIKAQTTLFDTPYSTTYNGTTLSMPYRIPALVETENVTTGEKELIYFGDKRHCGMDIGWGSSATAFGTYYRIDIVCRRSTDGGDTWGTETTVQEGTATCGYGDVAVVANHENPKEIMFMAATGNVCYGNSTRSNPLRTTRFYSEDGGQTWSSQDMTSSVYALLESGYTGLFFTSGRICQSKQIKVGDYYRIYSALCVYNGSTSNAFVVYSDDFGASWNLLGSGIAVSGGDESKIEELPNGNVLISSRIFSGYDSNGRRRFNVFNYSSLPTSANTASGSWGSYYSGIQYTGTQKPCNGELLLVPAKDASGNSCNILLHSEPYGTTLAEGRGNVSIFWKKLSSDNITSASEFSGTGWNRYSVSTTTSAYSTMILQHDGTIALAYEENIWGKGYDAPTESCNQQGWTELGYDLQYQNLSLATITGNAYSYYNASDEGTGEETVPVDPTFSFAESAVTKTMGDASFSVTLTNTSDGTVSYTSSNTAVATVASDGTVTLVGAGTTTITATVAATTTYKAATASYTLTVNAKEEDKEDEGTTTTVTKYRFKNVQVDGTVYYFKYQGTTDGLTLTTSESEATLYTRTVVDETNGVYNFQSEDGNYLIWRGSGEGYNSNLGYTNTYNSSYCDLTVSTLTESACAQCSDSNVGSYGYVYISGTRSDASTVGVFIVSSDGAFDKTTQPFYTSAYSSAFVIEEVTVEVSGGDAVETVATPTISPDGGNYTGSATVTITCATDGATIYYTTDGTTPSATNGTGYTGSFTLAEAGTYTVSAIAVKDGYTVSEVATAQFVINEETVVDEVVWPTTVISCANDGCKAASYSTLYLDHAVKIPSGVNAYRGVLDKENAILTLYRIRTGVIPAEYAVIIENTAVGSSVTFTKTDESGTAATNDLQGTLVDIENITPANYYVLGHTADHHLGFYHPNSTTLAANKAYIEWSSSSNARSLTVKRGDDNGTTAIDGAETEMQESMLIYDLMGRRVTEMQPGRIYIVNGKKTAEPSRK